MMSSRQSKLGPTETLLLNTIKANNISLNAIEKSIIANGAAAASAAATTSSLSATKSSSTHLLKNVLAQNPTINLATALNLTFQQQQHQRNLITDASSKINPKNAKCQFNPWNNTDYSMELI